MLRRLRDERGNALVTAIGVLTVTSVLTASVFAVSTRLSDSSNRSRDAKRALSAADAGLEAAIYRINKQNVQTTAKCFTNELVDAVAGECTGWTEDIGNGASYTYYVTPALADADTCAGLPVDDSVINGVQTIMQRCITSVGSANGQTRRVQARVASYIGAPIFPEDGIVGLQKVKVKNSAGVNGYLGSNGSIELGNNSSTNTVVLGPSAPNPTFGNGSSSGEVLRRSSSEGNYVLAPIDFGDSATDNDNDRIPEGDDFSAGSVSYSATQRVLTMGNNAVLTLGGGTYNFCKLTMGNNAQITIAVGAKVRIFLDSPDRAGSDCTPAGMDGEDAREAGYGTITMGQNANWNNTQDAINLQMYVYGWDDGSHEVDFNNSNVMNAAIYAPQSELIWNNSGTVTGGVAAREVEFKNTAVFTWSASLASLRARTVSIYYRTAWKECRRAPTTATDPESGCTTS